MPNDEPDALNSGEIHLAMALARIAAPIYASLLSHHGARPADDTIKREAKRAAWAASILIDAATRSVYIGLHMPDPTQKNPAPGAPADQVPTPHRGNGSSTRTSPPDTA